MVHTLPSLLKPISWSEVNRFSEVVALIEASVVSTRECDDKFSGFLIGSANEILVKQ